MTAPPAKRTLPQTSRRSVAPRFRLRSLFVVALLFCLVFGWIGRGLYRVRQEDAAIERLKQTGARLWLPHDPKTFTAPEEIPDPEPRSWSARIVEMTQRAIGWSQRPQVASVELLVDDPQSPHADVAIAALRYLPEVQAVTLAGAGFDDESLAGLADLPRLRMLSIWKTRATGAGLARIDRPERIVALVVHELRPEETRLLSGVHALTELRKVMVETQHITEGEVAALAALPRLETLTLPQAEPIGEHALAPLAQATGLRTLEVRTPGGIPFDREGLKTIAALPNLEELSFQHGLRDSDGNGDLSALSGMPRLRTLTLFECASPESARAFSAENPDCDVRLVETSGPWGAFRAGERTDSSTSEPVP